jgi:hypothetical protein
VIILKTSGELDHQHVDFPHRVPWRENSCAFPLPTLAQKARCLPFSGFTLRPKGNTPLELQTDLFLKSVKIRSFLGFAPLFEEPCPLRLRMAFLISSPDCRFVTEIKMLTWDVIELTQDGVSAKIFEPGGVAQEVRACGSYPQRRGFDSLHRHFFMGSDFVLRGPATLERFCL